MSNQEILTHWLQNPNKNYLGHWDLPNGQDVVLTIASAKWEIVKNPTTRAEESRRVIRFVENYKWIKPFICNETNAKTICKSTGAKYMEESVGKKIKLGVSITKVGKEENVDCIRVKNATQSELNAMEQKITLEQVQELEQLAIAVNKPIADICSAFKINSISELPEKRFIQVKQRLESLKPELLTINF